MTKRARRPGRAAQYLREAADLLDGHVEAEEVEGLASHRRQVVHAQGLLLSEGQVSIDPHLPLGLWAELVQPGDLLVSGGGGARLLRGGRGEIRGLRKKHRGETRRRPESSRFTFLDSGLGVPSTLLFIF